MGLIRVTRGLPKFNIQVGKYTDALGQNPSTILCVTDVFPTELAQFPMFQWVPINEIGKSWGYKPFFAVKRILDFWQTLNLPLIYLCCSGGVHRSPLMAFCWLLSQPNATPEWAAEQFYGNFRDEPLMMYQNDIKKGLIPDDLPEFYKVMNANPTWSYQGVLQTLLKYERILYNSSKLVID